MLFVPNVDVFAAEILSELYCLTLFCDGWVRGAMRAIHDADSTSASLTDYCMGFGHLADNRMIDEPSS